MVRLWRGGSGLRLDSLRATAATPDLSFSLSYARAAIQSRNSLLRRRIPLPLDRYPPFSGGGLWQTLIDRIHADPFNLVATLIFFLAICHTFLCPQFRRWAHQVEARHRDQPIGTRAPALDDDGNEVPEVSFGGQILHFLSEVEAVFGGLGLGVGAGDLVRQKLGHRRRLHRSSRRFHRTDGRRWSSWRWPPPGR